MVEIIVEDKVLKKESSACLAVGTEQETVARLVKSPEFVKACDRAGIPSSDRQLRKWTRGEGAAFKL
jgi:hypothetical protein